MYQKQKLLKNSYPFAAPPNRGHTAKYDKGVCPTAEIMYYEKMIINDETNNMYFLSFIILLSIQLFVVLA